MESGKELALSFDLTSGRLIWCAPERFGRRRKGMGTMEAGRSIRSAEEDDAHCFCPQRARSGSGWQRGGENRGLLYNFCKMVKQYNFKAHWAQIQHFLKTIQYLKKNRFNILYNTVQQFLKKNTTLNIFYQLSQHHDIIDPTINKT